MKSPVHFGVAVML